MHMEQNKTTKISDLKVGHLISRIYTNKRLEIQDLVKLDNLTVESLSRIHLMMNRPKVLPLKTFQVTV